MLSPFVMRLENGADLSNHDREALEQAVSDPRQIEARQVLIHDGDPPRDLHVVLEGIACRYKNLPDGRRQIFGFLLPGDMCDLHVNILGAMDHSIGTMTACKVARIPPERIKQLMFSSEEVTKALWWATLVDVSTCREWMTSMGQRSAERQLAHLLCELLARFQAVGLATDNGYDLALTQEEFGDTLGMSSVHMNRSLQILRHAGLVIVGNRKVIIPDISRMHEFAGFSVDYLHLKRPRSKQ